MHISRISRENEKWFCETFPARNAAREIAGENLPIFGQFLAKFDQKIDQFSSKLAAILIRSVMLFLSLVLIAFTKLSLKSILKNQYKKLCKELEVQNIRIFHNEILCIECRFTLP